MTQKFRYSGHAQIKHLNTRKEGPDDDKVLAVDLKVTTTSASSILDYFDEQLVDFLYTSAGDIRNPMIGEIPMLHALEDYQLRLCGCTHFSVKVRKFSIEPFIDRQVRLTLQISFRPSGGEIARIAEYLQDETHIELEPINGELALGVEGSA